MVLLVNGAFGIGKTVVARALVARLPDSLLFDAEKVGVVLQCVGRLAGQRAGDFQDLASWRSLTVLSLRAARAVRSNIIVPMAFSNTSYLREVCEGIARFDPRVFHCCLVAPVAVVHARLRERGCNPSDAQGAWQYRRAAECCAVHGGEAFAQHLSAVGRGPVEIAEELLAHVEHAAHEGRR